MKSSQRKAMFAKLRKGDEIIELSVGDDFKHKPMYGVTVLKILPKGQFKTDWESNRNKSFIGSKAVKQAYRYYKKL
jgi:hypothetical protein